ncbi:MAG TPA: hypothetical protein VFL57_06750 [Bryobacteraceae bacterium]|nr:hypothetical protein [Bryobacteraceae bacterium]
MKPKRKAQIATAVLMAVLGAAVLWKQGAFDRVTAAAQKSAAPQPQDAIYQTLDAVREGNLKKYIDAHTGDMEASLRRTAAEAGEARLLQSLQEQNAPLKGIAIEEPERLSGREVKARVEYVFADRNEVQTYYLERSGAGWKIARVDGAERIKTLVPYGTPVN